MWQASGDPSPWAHPGLLTLGLPEQQGLPGGKAQVRVAADWWQHCLLENSSTGA